MHTVSFFLNKANEIWLSWKWNMYLIG